MRCEASICDAWSFTPSVPAIQSAAQETVYVDPLDGQHLETPSKINGLYHMYTHYGTVTGTWAGREKCVLHVLLAITVDDGEKATLMIDGSMHSHT